MQAGGRRFDPGTLHCPAPLRGAPRCTASLFCAGAEDELQARESRRREPTPAKPASAADLHGSSGFHGEDSAVRSLNPKGCASRSSWLAQLQVPSIIIGDSGRAGTLLLLGCSGQGKPEMRVASSAFAVDGDLERVADLMHPVAAQTAQAFDERPDRNALDRIEIDDRDERNRVIRRLEENLGWDPADRSRAWADERTPETRDCGVSRKHNHRPAPDLRKLAPPDIASRRKRRHEEPAAARNEARSPHSSASSSGCAS